MASISTHVLDTSLGRPAAGVAVALERVEGERAQQIGAGKTDGDGRVRDLAGGATLSAGRYRIRFATGEYLAAAGRAAFFPEVTIDFEVAAEGHYHVPLLLSPFGYSTYRGS